MFGASQIKRYKHLPSKIMNIVHKSVIGGNRAQRNQKMNYVQIFTTGAPHGLVVTGSSC